MAVVYHAVERARSAPSAELSAANSIDVDSHGNLYVADAVAIRVLAPNGKLLRTIGRRGSGPGEFGGLRSVALMPGDSLFAFDNSLGRVTVFPPGTDRVAYTVQIGRDQLLFPLLVERNREGRSITAVFQAAYGDFDRRGTKGARRQVVRLLNADGSLRKDSVLSVAEPETFILNGEVRGVMSNPFGRQTELGFARRDRLVAAWTDSLKFDIYTPDGRLVKTIRPAYAPPRRAITAQERDSIVVELTSSMSPAPVVHRLVEQYRPTTWPLFQAMIVDDQDRIWVGITGARGEPHHWTAFDQDGALVARVDLPVNMLLRMVRGTTAYVAALDEDEVPHVIVYDLEPVQTMALNRR